MKGSIKTPEQLKPSGNEISHIQTLTPKKLVQQWSVYTKGGKYHLAKGMIFHERQTHEIILSSADYNRIIKRMTQGI